jgi:ParB family chromosome partitioning protein
VFASREAGLATIPVYLVEADEVNAERIVQQMVENDQREALTDGDRAAAFKQLAFEGLSVTAIARRTGTKQKEVKTALAVTENQVAASAIQEHQLTLDQAAVLIEFDGDDKIRADLIQVATTDPAQFAHAAQRARDEKARAQTRADTEAELATRGYTILDTDPGYYDTEYARISELLTPDDRRVSVELIENIEGRAAHVRVYADGDANVTYFVRDAKTAGFHTYGGSQTKSGPMTEERKAERRNLIANTNPWVSA